MAETPSNVQRGRIFVILAAAITLLGDAAVILLTVSRTGGVPIPGIARWLLTIGLFYMVWKGHRWAFWLIVCLLGAAFVLVLPAALKTMHPAFIAVMAQFAVTLVLLLAPNTVAAFQEHQRAKEAMQF